MREDIIKSTEYDFEKIHLRLFEKIDKEMELFKASYAGLEDMKIYNDWYIIGFYESYYDMLSCDFLSDKNAEEEIIWLSDKEEPLTFLYNEWMDSDGVFSHNWDNMLDFIRTVYEEELSKEALKKELAKKTPNNHLGEFDIPALMNTLSNNAWYGREPTKMSFWAGDDVITLEGYTYEPIYEDFSSTASVSFNDEVLYGLDSRNVDAYKNEVYHIGKFKTLDEAISHIKEQIKGKEIVEASAPSKLDKKIESATIKSRESIFQGGVEKGDIVLE